MLRATALRALLALGPLALAACVSPEADDDAGSAAAAQTERAHEVRNSPYFWAAEPFDQFRRSQAELGGQSLDPVSAEEPLTQRLQTWLDRIDALVRADVLARTGKPLVAPKPIAKIVASKSTLNAWVTSTPVCLDAPLGSGAEAGTRSLVDRNNVWLHPNGTCAHPDGWNAEEFVRFARGGARQACSLRLSGSALAVEGGSECMMDDGASSAEDTIVFAVSPYIQFTSDLVAAMPEAGIVAVAAHELGHYYLAHGHAKSDALYGFWYLAEEGSRRTPTRAPNSEELEAAYREVFQSGSGGPAFGEHYSMRTHAFLVGGLAPLLAERTEADFACAKARDLLDPYWTSSVLSGSTDPYVHETFVRFERELVACAPHVTLGDAGATSLSAGELLLAASHLRPGPKVKITLRLDDTLATFLERMDASAKALDVKAKRLIERARANGLGLYTTEQSADDFMLEMSTRLGFTSEEVFEGWLAFMRSVDRAMAKEYGEEMVATYAAQRGQPTTEACEAMLRDGFRTTDSDGRGAPVSVSLGDLEGAHHASCYRLFNLWREARAHAYEPGPRAERLDPAAWEALRARAAEISEAATQ